MMLLVTQQDVEDRMALGDIPAATPAVASALMASHLRMEGELDTKFLKRSNVDTFLCDPDVNGLVPAGFFRCRLKNGFVRATPAPVVIVGTTLDDLALAEVVVGYRIDYEKGFVFVPEVYQNRYVQVSYDSGFEADTNPDVVKPGEPVPDALKEAIISFVPVAVRLANLLGNTNAVVKDLQVTKEIEQHSLAVLHPLRRKLGFHTEPAF